MSTPPLVPVERTTDRLGDRARPAGRPPVARFVYSACTLDAVEPTRAHLAAILERRTGPLRCTDVVVEVAVGMDNAAELLADLEANRGQSTATLAPVIDAVGHVAATATALGAGPPVLLVASCGALTAQASTAVGLS